MTSPALGVSPGRRSNRGPAALALLVALASLSAAAQTVPANFTDTLVTTVGSPTSIAFVPDGRLLITTQGGALRIYCTNTTAPGCASVGLLPTAAITFGSGGAPAICSNFERGLLGVTVDPAFASNQYIYLFYTFNKFATCPTSQPTNANNPVNRVSRFVLPNTNVVLPASETILVDNILSPNGNHNAGDLKFGRDGYLYISTGDGGADYAGDSGSGGANDSARDQHQLIGKILRIDRDGNIPATNPFQGAGTARCNVAGATTAGNKCQETFAWGLRNPFRVAFDPNAAGTRFFINDVGQNTWEEIDDGTSGSDYGWNCREGNHVNNSSGPCNPTPPGMVNPLFEYQHGVTIPGTTSPTSCNSITGGAFVPNGIWPAAYDGAYLFADFVCGEIFRLTQAGPTWSASDFVSNLGSNSGATTLLFGPFGTTQALYYTRFNGGGQVRRIAYTPGGANNPPVAVANAAPLGGPIPLLVTFDATGSGDPDAGDTLTYFWNFGDGSPVVSTSSLTINHNYTNAGTFVATLQARDQNLAFSAPATVTVYPGNNPPVPTITFPGPADQFTVGQSVTLVGSATDPEQGALPNSALSWTVLLHHDMHTHPFLGPIVGNNINFSAPAPEDIPAAANSYLEVHLTATDSAGLPAAVQRNYQPKKVDVTLATIPAGLAVTANGSSFAGPSTFTSWEGWGLNVNAPNQIFGGVPYTFGSWSDAGAQSHTIPTPAAPATYTATFGFLPFKLYTVSPCRVLDTRNPDGPLGGPALSANTTRAFTITGTCGVPADARAVAVNLTVTGPTGNGYLTAYPTGQTRPLASSLNFLVGQTRANNAVLLLGTNGAVDVFAGLDGGGVHFLVDVVGYLKP